MYSFYGGRPGNSFVIITTFKSIQDMIDAFKQGPNYTAVHYDEYVMINTSNKNDPDNGKIFRRGYNFNEKKEDENGNLQDTGGAQFIGTIVGPSGNAPKLVMTTLQQIQEIHAPDAYESNRSSGKYTVNQGLIPGKIGIGANAEYNDEIQWECCSIRDLGSEDTTAYIGFRFPYPVFDFNVETIGSHEKAGIEQIKNKKENGEYEQHPFYKNLKIKIPKGIKGDSIKNLRVISWDNPQDINIETYDGKNQDSENQREILAYDIYTYDETNEDGSYNRKTLYLGDYNIIKDIKCNTNGQIIITYTHDKEKIINSEHPIKWIDSISLDSNTGLLEIDYNNKELFPSFKSTLNFINQVSFNKNNGKLSFKNTLGENPIDPIDIKMIKTMELDQTGKLNITYNTTNKSEVINLSNPIKWINNVNLDQTGKLNITYNTKNQNNTNESEIINLNNPIKWINNVNLDQTGKLEVVYNTKNQNNTNESEIINLNNPIQWIDNINLENNQVQFFYNTNTGTIPDFSYNITGIQQIELSETGELKVTLTNNNTPQIINQSNRIKWVKNILLTTPDRNYPQVQTLSITYNDNTTATLGTITMPKSWRPNDIININWIGLGQIINNDESTKTIVFYVNLLQPLNPTTTQINFIDSSSNYNINVIDSENTTTSITLSQNNTSIDITDTGLKFSISNIPSTSLTANGIINITTPNTISLKCFGN